MQSDFDQVKNMFEGDFSFSMASGSTGGCFSGTVFGTSVDFNPCPALSIISPIIQYMITIFFMVLTIRLTMNYMFRGD